VQACTRRRWLGLALSLAAGSARAEGGGALQAREVAVPNAGRFGRKCLVLRPAHVPESEPLPLLVLLHGLGETGSEALGIHAWYDRYGLPQAYARLSAPPIVRTLPHERYLSDARLAELNRELADTPFRDVALVCPFTPNVLGSSPSAPLLDRYADYIEQSLLGAVRQQTACLTGSVHLGLDGVSLGGYVALELFLRKPQLFGVIGCMQGAFGLSLAEVYARRIAELTAEVGPRAIHLTTTSFDPFRAAMVRLATRLLERGIPRTLTLADGPHDQRYLREAGTLEMLHFQARALHSG